MNLNFNKYWNKATRVLLILFLALMASGVVFVGNNLYLSSQTNKVSVVVAADNILPFTRLTSDNTTMREVTKSEIPPDAIMSLEELSKNGPFFTGNIGFTKGYPIRSGAISTAENTPYGSALSLQNGEAYVGIGVDQVRAAMVRPGVIVDAVCYIEGNMNVGPTMKVNKEMDPTLGNIQVVAVYNQDNQPLQGKGREAIPTLVVLKTISVAQYTALVDYSNKGKIHLLPVGANVK